MNRKERYNATFVIGFLLVWIVLGTIAAHNYSTSIKNSFPPGSVVELDGPFPASFRIESLEGGKVFGLINWAEVTGTLLIDIPFGYTFLAGDKNSVTLAKPNGISVVWVFESSDFDPSDASMRLPKRAVFTIRKVETVP